MKKVVFLILTFLIGGNYLIAQDNRQDRLGFGFGPSKIYGDNTGVHKKFRFMVLPAFSVDYHKKLHPYFDLRGTLGWQMISSGDFYTEGIKRGIANAGLPHAFNGNVIYADLMPIMHFNPNLSGYLPAQFKFYGGAGIGAFQSSRTERFLRIEDETERIETRNSVDRGVYFPFRLGVFKELYKKNSEIGLETSVLLSPFGELDGNSKKQKTIEPDLLFQVQIYYRINIGVLYHHY
ncbi:hypothetical protein [Pleomorphovibrio marinus]|uniref:hypothetical protein n=1 Tax=Pleomorphovibrio marinus TaxID=2164132 RepID=UPI000E0BC3A7|nr:hypothetical protein [Pleomorphovibrio marinus]